MVTYILALILAAIALLTISARKTYNFFPVRELKRQARSGDRDAAGLYKAVAYGASLRLLLWIIIGITVSISFVLFAQVAPAWLAGVALALAIWYVFAWAPSGRVGSIGVRLALIITPALAWILYYLHRPLDWLYRTIDRHRHITFHSGLFERSDLIELINDQKGMPGSRISDAELDIVLHSLSFGDKLAGGYMVPGRQVKTVRQTDTLGPVLLDELYDSKHSRFPVIDSDGHTIVGTLYLRDLVAAHANGSVGDVMKPQVYYVHESQTLYQVLHAFLTTKHQLFVVVNSDEQYVGIITIEDVLEQVIGRRINDEFDAYDDRSAVAGYPKRQSRAGIAEAVAVSDTPAKS